MLLPLDDSGPSLIRTRAAEIRDAYAVIECTDYGAVFLPFYLIFVNNVLLLTKLVRDLFPKQSLYV